MQSPHREALARVEHIVMLMLENRSFDHMLGWLALEGRDDVDGLEPAMFNDDRGKRYPVFPLERTAFTKAEDPDHSADAVEAQINGGALDGFVSNYRKTLERRRQKLAKAGVKADPGLVMGYYRAEDLPVYAHLAEHFCVCDRWFSSVPGATWPNRLYAAAGRAAAGNKDDLPTPPGPLHNEVSFARHLEEAGVSWRWYSHDPATLRLIDRHYRFTHHDRFAYFDRRAVSDPTKSAEAGLVTDNSFLDDVAEETLPLVSWIDPNFIDLSAFEHGSNDDHPPSDVHDGQRLVFTVDNALAQQPELWKKTLLIVTYDEHGGFFDHVEPPAAEDDDPAFRRYGVPGSQRSSSRRWSSPGGPAISSSITPRSSRRSCSASVATRRGRFPIWAGGSASPMISASR